ncbi:MAG: hypothetical protein R3D60_08440 [Paracoccaceae bacterium]
MFVKLPGWIKVPTSLESHNPDWAILVQEEGAERLYFVVETKDSLFTDDLRSSEAAKIDGCGAHFRALSEGNDGVRYIKPGPSTTFSRGRTENGSPKGKLREVLVRGWGRQIHLVD